MKLRIKFGKLLISLGNVIQSLAVVVMKPDDLVEFSRQTYARPGSIASFSQTDLVLSGFNEIEENFLKKIPARHGKILIVGVGGGREAIPLARMGFEITGLDFVRSMAETARKNVASRGLKIEVRVQDISEINFPPESFDIVWLSPDLYSAIPTRMRRIEMLKRAEAILRPGGFVLLQFQWAINTKNSPWKEFFKKTFAILTLGNLKYQTGDMLWRNSEFIHAFVSANSLRSELEKGGMESIHIDEMNGKLKGGALLRKR